MRKRIYLQRDALVVVDMQYEFLASKEERCLKNILQKIEEFKKTD